MAVHEVPGASDVKAAVALLGGYESARIGQTIYTRGVKVRAEQPSVHVVDRGGTAAADVRAIQRELEDPKWDFRWTASIAAATGLGVAEVRRTLEGGVVGRRPWGRPASDVYTSADKPVSLAERMSLIKTFITKRPWPQQ